MTLSKVAMGKSNTPGPSVAKIYVKPYVAPEIMSGHFDNMLDDFIHNQDVIGAQKHIDWLVKNSLPIGNQKNYGVIHMDHGDLKKATTPQIIKYAYDRRIRLGCTIRDFSAVDKVKAYNDAQGSDGSKKLRVVFHDVEPFRQSEVDAGKTYPFLKQLMDYTAQKLPESSGVTTLGYATWHSDPTIWPYIVKYCKSINITYYRASNKTNLSDMTGYLKSRMALLAAECKKQGVSRQINLFGSTEPEYDYDYFQTRPFSALYDLFGQYWNTLPATTKTYLKKGGLYLFVTKYSTRIKP